MALSTFAIWAKTGSGGRAVLRVAGGERLVRDGETGDAIGRLQTGLLRKYRASADRAEHTTDFLTAGSFAAPYSDQLRKRPARLTIEALEPSVLALISFRAVRRLTLSQPDWMRAGSAVLEELLEEKEDRETMLLSLDAAERLRLFRERYPDLASRVPKRIVASYLGVNPSTLSRLIGKAISRA